MKKLLKLLIFVVLLGVAAYAGYRYFLPSMIASTLTSAEPSRLVPEKMQQQVKELRAKIDREVKEVPALLKETRLGIDDLEIIIDRANPEQFFNAIAELKTTTLTSTDQIFDICMKHIRIDGYDLEVFRGPFVRNTSVKNIREAVAKVNRDDMLTQVSVPVLKETAKQVLASSREKILAEMNR
ncbi:MAG: hypothetical protein HKP21_08655 [Xanthomonadales bacterium]|nr:hypothetical protein [Gammaproteobacteria bacterium]NNK04610.1 hypothetical protein [Xanthomonadales bacterium]